MPFEVDFLNVGDGEKSGDAIALRLGDLVNGGDQQTVVVIDGGNKVSGDRLVTHIREFYRTNRVDLVINTHPDADHASGLSVVLEKMAVDRLWMHRPWNHAEARLFKDGRITDESLEGRLREELVAAHALELLALNKGVAIEEPFTGMTFEQSGGWLSVLGPSSAYYKELLLQFRSTPEPKAATMAIEAFLNALNEGVEYAKSIIENWGYETLGEPAEDATSAENNSSAIVLFQCDGEYCLFTGDAGVPALTRAADFAQDHSINLSQCRLHQVPHHGSRRNVSPTILDRILGPKLAVPSDSTKSAFVSAATEAPKHPSKKVTNAYIRRGRKVIATKGKPIRHSYKAPDRAGWSAAEPILFQSEIDEEGDE
jgi:beta-lactamase superfamily II metal-dependent hydrolase